MNKKLDLQVINNLSDNVKDEQFVETLIILYLVL